MDKGMVRLRRLKVRPPTEQLGLMENIKEEDIEEDPVENEVVPAEERAEPDDETIQRNLRNARLAARKKRAAQECFYRKHAGWVEERAPVRQRLGAVRLRRKATADDVAPTRVLRRRPPTGAVSVVSATNGIIRRRSPLKRLNGNTAQARMERIRALQKSALRNAPVRLRRLQPAASRTPPPTNLVVQVPNFDVARSQTNYPSNEFVERFQLALDPKVQDSIRFIQQEASLRLPKNVVPIGRVTPEATDIVLSFRFSQLT